MIIYNVTLKVDNEIADEWVAWMKSTHMKDLMGTGLFTDCRLCRLMNTAEPEDDGSTFSAQYSCDGIEQYNKYIDEHADRLREEMLRLFAGKFVAFRTLMETV